MQEDYEKYMAHELKPEEMDNYPKELSLATADVLEKTNVVVSTLINASKKSFKDLIFAMIIIVEATQTNEPETMITIIRFTPRHLILVGDHRQIRPIIISDKARTLRYDVPYFEELLPMITVLHMLDTQYRMIPILS